MRKDTIKPFYFQDPIRSHDLLVCIIVLVRT
jgi:hypothetical protein